jgi:hypothetical protein
MSTKISLTYNIPGKTSFKLPYESFFCKEESYIVLKKLITQHPIHKYKTISSLMIHNMRSSVSSDILKSNIHIDESPSFRKLNLPKDSYKIFYSLEIIELPKDNLPRGFSEPVSSINDFDNFLIQPNIHNQPFQVEHPNSALEGLVLKNLVSYDLRNGSPSFGRKKNPAFIVEGVNNYLITREKKQNPELEEKLENIMEFAYALTKKPIGVNYLKSIKLNILKPGEPYSSISFL